MLQSLHVHNFALLEDAQAHFTEGFNIFSGETGAGKSILIDAFNIVLGGRGSAEYIRTGAESFWIQAVFDIAANAEAKAFLEEQDIECEDGLFIKRQVNLNGKGKISINGVQVPVNVLRRLGGLLVNIHGQHENQLLLQSETPRLMTDDFGGEAIAAVYELYKEAFCRHSELEKYLTDLQKDSEQQEFLLDLYDREISEISAADLRDGEDERLEEEAKLHQNSERIIRAVDKAYNLLDEDKGVLAMLADAKEQLRVGARYDVRLQNYFEAADSAWLALDDCRGELSSYLGSSEFNSERAAKVQERLDLLRRLQKKYGGSIAAVREYLLNIKQKYTELQSIAQAIAEAEKKLFAAAVELKKKAALLTEARCKHAAELSSEVTAQIRDLAMPRGVFEIVIRPAERYTADGGDIIVFKFSANEGEPVDALEKVASGGELSRVALALKTALLGKEKVDTVVFDEIDTGVGGVTAQRMAEKLVLLSGEEQIICITHLPQVAALADNHIYIEKFAEEGRTVTRLTPLDHGGRVSEIVRMTVGENISEASVHSAEELLARGAELKRRLRK